MTPTELRTTFINCLGSLLGNYRRPNNTLTPAIYMVSNPSADPPKEWKAEGLEVLISRVPLSSPKATFGGCADICKWRVKLTQHDRTKSLAEAKQSVFSGFKRAKVYSYYPQTQQEPEQMILMIPDSFFIQEDK